MKKQVPFLAALLLFAFTDAIAFEAIVHTDTDAIRRGIGGFVPQGGRETAIVAAAAAFPAAAGPAAAIMPGLLPQVVTPNLLPQVKLSSKKMARIAPAKPAAGAANPPTAKKPAPAPITAPASAPAGTPATFTARSFLDATAMSLVLLHDGTYKMNLGTAVGGGTAAWGLDNATVGGAGGKQFSVSYSCDPQPNLPPPGSGGTIPTFNVRTSYACTVNLTPTAGTDLHAETKIFNFVTDPGPLIVSPPASMNTILANGENDGGFVFSNQDSLPVTVTGITVDVSYMALNTQRGNLPLVMRFVDPATGNSLGDYHMENFPAAASPQYTYANAGIQIPATFTVGGSGQKMLPLQILGVNRMSIAGVNPSVTVALRSISINQGNTKVILRSPSLSWSCVVATSTYDPNAMSGPYADGTACQ